MAQILLKDLRKTFDQSEVVCGIDLNITHNEFVVLVGPSGCGKTTTLRMIAGLEDVSGGNVIIGDRIVNDVPPKDRDVAMVFQNYALYPHMTVYQNMSFGLRLRKISKQEIHRRVEHAADILNISELLERRPKQLSGGQRQRVAMGRSIVRNPEVFLFDEPLSNLDAKLRVQMRTEIKKIHQRVKTTVVYVTHDQVEAMTLADRIVVMNDGIIEQVGTPQEMYERPSTRFVAGFLGSPAMNFIPCHLVDEGPSLSVKFNDDMQFKVPHTHDQRYRSHADQKLLFGIRPEHVTESRKYAEGEFENFDAKVQVLEPMGIDTMVYFSIDGTEICGRATPGATKAVGESMPFMIDMHNMHLIDPQSNKVI